LDFQVHSSIMKSFSACFAAALATVAVAAPVENYEERTTTATPKVYLAGDSTMALGGGGTGTQGTLLSSPSSFPN
jgi:rhamnogalacturonan acetylesterase